MNIHAHNFALLDSKVNKIKKLLTKLDSEYIPVEPYLHRPQDLSGLSMNDLASEVAILVKRINQLEKGLSDMRSILS